MQRRWTLFLCGFFLTAGAAACTSAADAADSPMPSERTVPTPAAAVPPTPGSPCISAQRAREEADVIYVTDGDSFEVEMNGVKFRVRLIGIDAPEMGIEPSAGEARTALREMLEGRRIILIRDLSEADAYGRLLRYVFIDGVFVNREMVQRGLARAGWYPPDTACTEEFLAAEESARQDGSGFWGAAVVDSSESIPDGGSCRQGCTTPAPGCEIKGNINLEGEKIYHVPSGEYYEKTVIEPEKGERWFCSEEDAAAAGWRRSKR